MFRCLHHLSVRFADAELINCVSSQAGGLGDRLAESADSTTDPLARQGAFETYTALVKDIGTPIEPFVAGVLSTILDKCSDKVNTSFPSA